MKLVFSTFMQERVYFECHNKLFPDLMKVTARAYFSSVSQSGDVWDRTGACAVLDIVMITAVRMSLATAQVMVLLPGRLGSEFLHALEKICNLGKHIAVSEFHSHKLVHNLNGKDTKESNKYVRTGTEKRTKIRTGLERGIYLLTSLVKEHGN